MLDGSKTLLLLAQLLLFATEVVFRRMTALLFAFANDLQIPICYLVIIYKFGPVLLFILSYFLSGLFGTYWYCNPVLRTVVERLGKDGDGSLQHHMFTMISRLPGHFVEFCYDLHHNSLLVKAHVSHLVPYDAVRHIPDEISRDLSLLRMSLLGEWTMSNCADDKLNGQSIVIYLVERNSVEFNDEKGNPVIFTVAWGYSSKNSVKLNAGQGVFECSMKLDHSFRDFNGWWFNAHSDFIHPSRYVRLTVII